MATLFDRYVDLMFYGKNPQSSSPDFSIITPGSPNSSFPVSRGMAPLVSSPVMNRKPEINITGTFVNTVGVPGLTIRVTNLTTPFPIWQYATTKMDCALVVEAGYIFSPETRVRFKGRIMTASEEKPSPDSITNITLLLGEFSNYTTNTVPSNTFNGGTLRDIFNYVIPYMNSTFFSYSVVDDPLDNALSQPVSSKYNMTGRTVNDIFNELKNDFGLNIQVIGETIRVIRKHIGFSNYQYQIDNIMSATRNADSYVIKGPWVPSILPNDQIKINPKVFKQSLGGAQAGATIVQDVISVNFDFSTVGRTNTMELLTVNPGES
jgi:hypothetical protein